MSNTFQVEEINIDHPDLIVLSIGFCSAADPLDVLHIACARHQSGADPLAAENLLYMERTDQSLACDGRDVISLRVGSGEIELHLTPEGARLLELDAKTCFAFDERPDLWTLALAQVKAMADAGQQQVRLVDE